MSHPLSAAPRLKNLLPTILQYGLKYGNFSRILTRMKTTIDLDEEKLERVMKLGGIGTRKEAVEFALSEAERALKLRRFLRRKWSTEELKDAVDPNYDLMKLREMDKPDYGPSH